MKILILLLIVLNVLLAFAILALFSRLKKENQAIKKREAQILELSELKNTLDKSLEEALRISNQIQSEIENQQKVASQVIQSVETEKFSLMDLLEKLKSESFHKTDSTVFKEPWLNDKYSSAVKLSAEGFSPQEIAKKVKLPIGEVELVLNLRK